MAVLHAAAAVALAKIAVFQPGDTTFARAAALALLVGAAALWGALDGWTSRPDSGRTWFIAGLVAGPLAGVLSVIGKAVLVDQTGTGELGAALTGGAAFTALLVIVPAAVGLLVGGRLPRPGGDLDDDPEETEQDSRTGDSGTGDSGSETTGRTRRSGRTRTRSRRHRATAGRDADPEGSGAGSVDGAGSVGDADGVEGDAWKAPAVAEIPSGPDPARAKPDEREETVMTAKPRPYRHPRPSPRTPRGTDDTTR